jgi:hypothetical protein
VLFALGLTAAAIYVGRSLGEPAGDIGSEEDALKRGLLVLAAASIFPFAGWAMAVWAIAAGAGAVAEAMLAKK